MHNQFKTQKFKHMMLAMGPRDVNSAPYSPVHCSSHSMTSFQSSELTELPVVENSQLFAQRAHSARYAPLEMEDTVYSKLWVRLGLVTGGSLILMPLQISLGYLGLWDCSPFLHRHANVDQLDSGIAVHSTGMQTNK